MAASMGCYILLKQAKLCSTSQIIVKYVRNTTSNVKQKSDVFHNIEQIFIRPDVQSLLKRITGFDVNKIFHERQISGLERPKYKLLTRKQLDEYKQDAVRHGIGRLQMPPVKKPWSTTDHGSTNDVLAVDNIARFERTDTHYVFTDISYGLPNRERVVTVRENDGTLRLANHEERDRILNAYYPRQGKMYNMPKMFSEENLEKILEGLRYEYILDRACLQFEPDDPNYVRVTQRTYEHVANKGCFDMLRSTRHFGPMAFYLTAHHHIDSLLIDMLQRALLSDAGDLVRLYHIMHSDCESATEAKRNKVTDPQQLVELFARYDAASGGTVQLALQSYLDSEQNKKTTGSV